MTGGIPPQYYTCYDLLYDDRTVDLGMWRRLAEEADGPVLEVGCGTGRVLVALAETGQPLTGIDLSSTAIDLARRKIEAAHVSILQADMRTLDLPTRDFALVLIPFNTFLHCASQEEQLSCLNAIHAHMADGARLAIDVLFPPTLQASPDSGKLTLAREIHDSDGELVQWYTSYQLDMVEQRMDCTQTLDRLDTEGAIQRTVIGFRYRFIYRYEMTLLLRTSGFTVESTYGGYDFSPLQKDSQKMIFIARRSSDPQT